MFLSELSMGDQAVAVLLSILSAKETVFDQPSDVDAREVFITPSKAARILAEIKTRFLLYLTHILAVLGCTPLHKLLRRLITNFEK